MLIPLLFAAAAVGASPMPVFMTGCWLMKSPDRMAEECWTPGNGGLMIGSGRAWVGERIDNWEWMRIERAADGRLTFYASPNGVPATAFGAVEVGDGAITFENRAHDYPQRVRYWRTKSGISAEISLADGSKPVRYDFKPMGGPAK